MYNSIYRISCVIQQTVLVFVDSQVKLQAEQQARNKEWELERDTETVCMPHVLVPSG